MIRNCVFIFILVSSALLSAEAKAASSQSYSAWDKVSGPGSDVKCSGICSTGSMLQTVECGGRRQGLLTLSDANSMFCSSRSITNRDESIVKYNADQIQSCFKSQPKTKQNTDQYQVFIHEMLCNWKLCKANPPRNLSVQTKAGVWTTFADGKIQMLMCKPNISSCANQVLFVESTSEFGALLLSRNINFCDLGMDAKSLESGIVAPLPNMTAPVLTPGQTSPRMTKQPSGVSH